mmetsp:Transcript_73498/g.148032  ORF Transcript_73498/g.148032 Transcript_73498/m.148032 type:complete len:225 (-) Transcript_73498:493-1167(-)
MLLHQLRNISHSCFAFICSCLSECQSMLLSQLRDSNFPCFDFIRSCFFECQSVQSVRIFQRNSSGNGRGPLGSLCGISHGLCGGVTMLRCRLFHSSGGVFCVLGSLRRQSGLEEAFQCRRVFVFKFLHHELLTRLQLFAEFGTVRSFFLCHRRQCCIALALHCFECVCMVELRGSHMVEVPARGLFFSGLQLLHLTPELDHSQQRLPPFAGCFVLCCCCHCCCR